MHNAITLLPHDFSLETASTFKAALDRSGSHNAWLSWIEETTRTIEGCSLLAENFEVDAGSHLLESVCPHVVVTPDAILLRASCTRTGIKQLFWDISRYPSIVFMGSYSFVGSSTVSVTREEVLQLAHASRYVLVGAYDEDGFVAAELK